ncbi:2853_t:CDS:2, partial [Cetraspora pellucida]
EVKSLLAILDRLVVGISLFESDTPRLALFYYWYHELLESGDIAQAVTRFNNRPAHYQKNIELLDSTDDNSNDSYKEILAEDADEELLENYSNIEESDSETDKEVDNENDE